MIIKIPLYSKLFLIFYLMVKYIQRFITNKDFFAYVSTSFLLPFIYFIFEAELEFIKHVSNRLHRG